VIGGYAASVDTEAAAAFWSYTHKDNEGEGGRIVQLARDLQAQYGVLTGGELTLFLDEDKIEWGDDLRDRIDKAIAETTFFIPIITARYFQSDECRKELIAFSQRATIKKASSLLLPIYYTDVPELSAQDGPTNSTMRLVKEHKWEDWRSLCLEDISSAEYRKGVRHLAERLVGVVRDLTGEQGSPAIAQSETSTSSTASAQVADAEDEEPGLVELLAEGEEAMPEWTKIIGAASPEIEQIGNLAGEAAEQMTVSDAKGGGASGRLKITIGLAEKLKPHADAILTLGQANAAIMVKVGPAISALLERIEADPQLTLQTEGVPEFIDGIKTLAQNGKGAVASLQGFSTSFDQTAKLSRALRPPIRDIQNGLRGFVDAQAIYDEWERRIEDIYTEADSDTEPDAG
jgi:hypothetical protein